MNITLGAVPSLGALVGTVGGDGLLRQINQGMNNNEFFNGVGDMLGKARQCFVENVVRPIRMIGDAVKNLVGRFEVDERIVAIVNEEMLKQIPTCMHAPILQYEPVRKLFDQGRIFGFGWTAIPEEDPYGRLISNGFVQDVLEAMDENGDVTFNYEFLSTDPDLSYQEIDDIEETRKYIDWVLENTTTDLTDPYLNDRG